LSSSLETDPGRNDLEVGRHVASAFVCLCVPLVPVASKLSWLPC
jgi:hypothetical protein